MTDVQAEAGPSSIPDGGPSAAAAPAKAIPVRLTSRTDKHAIPESKFMIPSDWRRFQLSELINKVLANEQAVPFDFVVGEELLRTSLGQFTQSKGLTEETVLEIEYVESVLPPKYLSAFQHEDWVSDVDMGVQGSFLTASYDSHVRIFSSSGQTPQTLSAHTLPVLSACWLPSEPSTSGSRHVASGGMDRVVRIFNVPSAEGAEAANTHALSLHTAPVSSVRSRANSGKQKQLISAGWDGLVAFWEFDPSDPSWAGEEEEEADSARTKKRRKGANGASTTGEKVTKVRPTLVLPGHAGQVSRAIFSHDSSAGLVAQSFGLDDHSIRTWDLGAGGTQSGLKQSDKAILAGAQLASANLLLTGNADRTVCLWDTRETERVISLTLTGHTASVAAVAAHPTSQLLFSSAGYDGTVKVWDARSPKQALFSVQRQKKQGPALASAQNKILCMAWNGELIASGGEDGKLELLQSKGM